jgi:Ca2+-binding EF-hand superfamily protein
MMARCAGFFAFDGPNERFVMRFKIAFACVPIMVIILLVLPDSSSGQGKGGWGGGFPGGGGGFPGGGKGGKGGFGRDPNAAFDFLAKGRGYFLASENMRLREPLTQFLQDKGVTNGQVTRELFAEFNDQTRATMGFGGGFPQQGGFAPQGGGPGQGFPGAGGPAPVNPVDAINQWAEADFKRLDRNGDGFLNQDEMPEQLKTELSKWDTNRDNLISVDEYKVYFAAKMQTRRGRDQSANPVTIILEEEDLETRPVVFRAGKLPTKELPPWFMEIDYDKDGQIALWEWRKAGKDLDDFREWDRNNDGIITPEEAIYKLRNDKLASAKNKSEEDGDVAVSASSAEPSVNRMNGFGGKGKGRGNPGSNGDSPWSQGKGKGGKGKSKKSQE